MVRLPKEMSFLEHVDELRIRLLRIMATVVVISLFAFLFGIERFRYGETMFYLPYPNAFDNIAGLLIKRVQSDMLPEHVKLIVTSPGQAIIAQLYVSIFLGILLGMPVIVHQICGFVNPALYPHERESFLRLIAPSVTLFVIGAVFSYVFVTPVAIKFLYVYGVVLGAETFITVNDLMAFVLLFALAGGLSFQLPLMMWVVTRSGLVDPDFWLKNLRYAIVAIAIFGAVITPDHSGVTMWLIAGPMVALYLAACLLLRRQAPKT